MALERAALVFLVLSNIVTFIKTATSNTSRFQSIGVWILKKLSKIFGRRAAIGERTDSLQELGEPLVGDHSPVDEEMDIFRELMAYREASGHSIPEPGDLAAPPCTNPIDNWDI